MTRLECCFAASIVAAAPCTAWAQHTDIELSIEDGRIQTRAGSGVGDPVPERVFESEFGELLPNFSDEPGFDCEPGTFPVPSALGFRVLRALRVWDTTGFDTIPTERLLIEFSTLSRTTPATDQVVEGFTLDVGSNGQWHRHLEFSLLSPAADGVYLLELDLFSTIPAIAPSLPFWIIFNQNRPHSEVEDAEAWVRGRLIGGGCVADVDDGSGTGTPDGGVTIDDLLYYLGLFEIGDADADVDDGSATGTRDGGVTIDDLLYYLLRFAAGC